MSSRFLVRHSARVIAATVAITFLLLPPLFLMDSDEDASLEPGGEVFDLRAEIAERFPPPIFEVLIVVEARDGDVLTGEVLAELSRNLRALREADARGELAAGDLEVQPYLFPMPVESGDEQSPGGYTFVDAVADMLVLHPSLGIPLVDATDDQVKVAVDLVLEDPSLGLFRELLASDAESEAQAVQGYDSIDVWTSPAMLIQVAADNEKLGGRVQEIVVGGDSEVLDTERLQRNIQAVLRGDEVTYRLWAVGADANLQARDDGEAAGPFILLTVVAALAMVGMTLRSYWAVALTGAGLGMLMIWLKGSANLVGIQGGLVIDVIVPIAMVSLGVDFAIHAVRRYREERDIGYAPVPALRVGFGGVLGALVLAMLSGSAAFAANVTSPIAGVAEFGLTAAMAVFIAFIVLGVAVPLVLGHVDTLLLRSRAATSGSIPHVRDMALRVGGGALVAVTSGTGVIVLVALDEAVGVALIFASILLTVVLPLTWLQGRARRTPAAADEAPHAARGRDHSPDMGWMAPVVTMIGRRRWIVLALAVVVTGVALFYATRLEAGMDVQDMFSSDSDLVVGLNKLEEHLEQHQREPAHAVISGDLTDPGALAALRETMDAIEEHPHALRGDDGRVRFEPTILDVLGGIVAADPGGSTAYGADGVRVTDATGDGLPDTPEQVRAALDHAVEEGVPGPDGTLLFSPVEVRQVVHHEPGATEQSTIVSIEVLGTRETDVIRQSQRALETSIVPLEGEAAIDRVGVTGPAFTRQASLDATTTSLQRSFPLAAAAVFILLLVSMRSVRYAVVTIVPIGLVAAWLYGLMGFFGFDLNLVTATIGAVSIGVGIDYAIHLTERFREELQRTADRIDALEHAARGTGAALLTSAASSIVGFMVMSLAPMPLFAAYGLLTAIMIFMALSASLLVLPALLVFATPERAARPEGG